MRDRGKRHVLMDDFTGRSRDNGAERERRGRFRPFAQPRSIRGWLAVSRLGPRCLEYRCAGVKMQQAELETGRLDHQQEAARLAALIATGILDTPPEPGYDAITRLAAEYFRADSAGLGFADESRIWMKSSWGRV